MTKNNNNPTKHVDFYAKLKIRAARATKRVRQKREEHFVKERERRNCKEDQERIKKDGTQLLSISGILGGNYENYRVKT